MGRRTIRIIIFNDKTACPLWETSHFGQAVLFSFSLYARRGMDYLFCAEVHDKDRRRNVVVAFVLDLQFDFGRADTVDIHAGSFQ